MVRDYVIEAETFIKTRESLPNERLMIEHLEVIDSKWWPETGSNRRRRPFQGLLPIDLSGLESADDIDTKDVKEVLI